MNPVIFLTDSDGAIQATKVRCGKCKMDFTDTEDMSRFALQGIRDLTSDPEIRRQIDDSLR